MSTSMRFCFCPKGNKCNSLLPNVSRDTYLTCMLMSVVMMIVYSQTFVVIALIRMKINRKFSINAIKREWKREQKLGKSYTFLLLGIAESHAAVASSLALGKISISSYPSLALPPLLLAPPPWYQMSI